MVTTGGICKIAYAMPNDGGTVSVKEICNIGNGALTEEVSPVNGCNVKTQTLTFLTLTDPHDFAHAIGFYCVDRAGVSTTIGPGNDDDYPVVTWTRSNSKEGAPAYNVKVVFTTRDI